MTRGSLRSMKALAGSFSRQLVVTLHLFALIGATQAHAHLMVAQHGTLNIVGDGAFMVLSLPASAFPQADDSGDGLLSLNEFQTHQAELLSAVQANVQLLDENDPRPLDGLLLSLSPDDDAPNAPAANVVALGRFVLARGELSPRLQMQIALFGSEGKSIDFTVTRAAEKHVLTLGPEQTRASLFTEERRSWLEAVANSVEHVSVNAVHLVLMLLVLTAGAAVLISRRNA